MASLQDQLLKAGLVDKNKANKVRKEKQKKAKANRHSGAKIADEVKLAAQQELARKAERDRELNRRKQLDAENRAVQAQIRQLVQMNRIDTDGGEFAYSFVDQGKVKSIYVNEAQQKQLSLGRLAIVTLTQGDNRIYQLVPTGVAEKIAQRDESYIVQLNVPEQGGSDEEDFYADYKIPDDLMW